MLFFQLIYSINLYGHAYQVWLDLDWYNRTRTGAGLLLGMSANSIPPTTSHSHHYLNWNFFREATSTEKS